MQGTSFVVLTGHLSDYPLASLIGILRRQRKTGRLLIEYPAAPCSLYFDEGNLVDAQLNTLSGLQAIYVALSQPDASFNFNPLIRPPQRSIDDPAQKVLMESLGCTEEKVINVQARTKDERTPTELIGVAPATLEAGKEALPEAAQILALPAAALPARSTNLKREVFAASAIILSLVSLLAVVALVGERRIQKTRALSLRSQLAEGAPRSDEAASGEDARAVLVVVQIENGRVSKARIAKPQAEMEAYQALALRIARARRYPAGTTRQETVSVEIRSPNQQQPSNASGQ
ncbi:MAG TPA: DUF4388 domain-containing protein [Pyrinomonadaceae bacterium]|jgi:hypothetical protein